MSTPFKAGDVVRFRSTQKSNIYGIPMNGEYEVVEFIPDDDPRNDMVQIAVPGDGRYKMFTAQFEKVNG